MNNLYEKVKQTITEDSFIDGVVTNNFRKNIHEFIADALTKSTFRNALKKEGILDEVETAINNVIEKIPKDDVSKVVDENGEPLVVYHSTNKIFDTYKERDGIHFGSYNTALGVANEKFDPTFDTIEEAQASIAKGKFRIDQVFLNIRNPKQSKDLGTGWNKLITEGFDGGFYRAVEGDTSFVVFDSNQIKSINNNGEYSMEKNNINETYMFDLEHFQIVRRDS